VEERYHRVFGGRLDMELSPRGHTQAAALAKYLRPTKFDVIYTSPLRRAQQTVAPLAGQCPTAPIVRADLCEVDFGDWTGLGWEEVRARYQVSAFEWLRLLDRAAIPNAECGRTFRARVEPCLQQILGENAGQSVAVMCHGGVIRMILSILLEMPLPSMAGFEIDYASLTQIDHQPPKTEVKLLNFTPWRDLA
jgi:broad specificity phosphatase PhoE